MGLSPVQKMQRTDTNMCQILPNGRRADDKVYKPLLRFEVRRVTTVLEKNVTS